MNNRTIQKVAFIVISSSFVWLLAACQSSPTEVFVTRVVTSVAQEIVEAPTTVVVREVTATPQPTAVPTETPSLTPTPELPLATNPIQLSGHEAAINSIRFSPDSQLILAASDDGTARMWDLEGNLHMTFAAHTERVRHAIFSPDGNLIVTSGDDETARIWSVDGELLHVLMDNDPVNSALFTPDGRFIITNAREPKIWDTEGNLLATLEGHRSMQVRSWLSPNGQFLLTTSGDSTIFFWELQEDGQATLIADLAEAAPEGHLLNFVSFFPDNQRFITSSRTIIIWGILPTGDVVKLVDEGLFADIIDVHYGNNIAFLEDWTFGIVAVRNGADPGNPVYIEGHNSAIASASFSETGTYVLTGSNDHTARLWDLEGETVLIFSGHEFPVQIALFSPDQNYVVTGDREGFIKLWDISSLP